MIYALVKFIELREKAKRGAGYSYGLEIVE